MMQAPALSGIEQWLFDQAARQAWAPAILAAQGGDVISYGELAERVRQLARRLQDQGVQPGEVLALCLPPSAELVVALWAALAIGAAFLPLDAAVPDARLHAMVRDVGTPWVLTQRNQAARFAGIGDETAAPDVLLVDGDWPAARSKAAVPVDCATDPLAYVMYTSGSSGRPKGVAMGHAALRNKLAHPGAWGRVGPGTRAVMLGSIAFDATLAQVLLPLAHGGSLLILDEPTRLAPHRFWAALREARVNLLDVTPSLLNVLLQVEPVGVPLKRLVLGGEALSMGLVRKVQSLWPEAVLVNAYGPTEACIDATMYELRPGYTGSDVPIGRALPNYRVYLLDADLRAVEQGQPGELWVAGAGLARGYWGQPALTAERFLPDPWIAGQRMYRTGDQARRNAQGDVEFLGRVDSQVKLRGQRMELEEIEAVLQHCSQVHAAAVTVHEKPGALPRLTAYLVPRNPHGGNAALLSAVQLAARELLPSAMRPVSWQVLSQLPLTPSGKLDRRALPPPVDPVPTTMATPATDPVEQSLLALWTELLQLPGLEVDDNFFEFGGDSLLAVTFSLRVHEQLGIDVPAEALMAYPTVAELARAWCRQEQLARGDLLLRLSESTRPDEVALFCLPPLSGVGTVYARLAKALAEVCPVRAFHLGALDGDDRSATNERAGLAMSHLVERLANRLIESQPQGTVRLLGYSAGGSIAHQLAEHLQQRGVAVSHLFLVDPYCADAKDLDWGHNPEASSVLQLRFWEACRDMIWEAMDLKGEAGVAVLDFAQRWWHAGGPMGHAPEPLAQALQREARHVLPRDIPLGVFNQLLLGAHHTWQAWYCHRPAVRANTAKTVWLLQPDSDDAALLAKRQAEWQAYVAPRLKVLLLPGSHPRMLLDAATVTAIADCVRGAIG